MSAPDSPRRSSLFTRLFPIYAALLTLVGISMAAFALALWPAESCTPERAQRAERDFPPGHAVEGRLRPDPEARPKGRMRSL